MAVEAARGESYRRWVGGRGLVYGIDRFGASAPIGALAAEYGFTRIVWLRACRSTCATRRGAFRGRPQGLSSS